MKRIIFTTGLLCIALMVSHPSDAQFFKKLADKVSERVEDKIINDAGDAAVKGVDKTEDAVGEATISDNKNNRGNRSAKQGEVQGSTWPVQTTQDQGDEQSLHQNHVLQLTGSGPDIYLEYTMKMEGKKSTDYQMDMRIKMVASPSSGMGRSEMAMKIPMVGEMGMVTLTNVKDPLRIVLLNERKKEYSIIDLTDIGDGENSETYTVKRMGKEKIHGLHCIHSVATNQGGQTFELWTTTEIPGYEKMVELYSKTQQTASGDLWEKLKDAGAAGCMVKLKVSVEGGSSVMELTQIKNLNAPASLFNIPSGYEKKEGGWVNRYLKNRR